jgi:hypothetical protein
MGRRQLFNLKNPSRLPRLSLLTILIFPEFYLAGCVRGREIALSYFSESFKNPDEAENCLLGSARCASTSSFPTSQY